ncbi:protein-glucosylgalactosylhydroxylysine glucosidase-like [Saccoglossus kowalevskii]
MRHTRKKSWRLLVGRFATMRMAKVLLFLMAVSCTLTFVIAIFQRVHPKLQPTVTLIDISPEQTTFQSTELPLLDNGEIDSRYMATVGNGHAATTVYSDTVYVNGIYNGVMGDSHRARIPSQNSIRVKFSEDIEAQIKRKYTLDVGKGVWREVMNHDDFTVTLRIYAHQYFSRVLVTQIEFTKRGKYVGDITMTLEKNEGVPSEDINFSEPRRYPNVSVDAWEMHGTTNEPELDGGDQTPVYMYYTHVPESITVMEDDDEDYMWTYVCSIDWNNTVAMRDFVDVVQLIYRSDSSGLTGGMVLLEFHTERWEKIWENGRIEVDNLMLGKRIYGSLYYILSSLPASESTHQPPNQFFGLSPGGLANGAFETDYQGHSFWDTETWMYPPVLMFRPDIAKNILSYRWHGRDTAEKRAELNGHLGTRYPWESAYTGAEVTPDCCITTRENQQHITSDIAFAARQYFSATRDMDWVHDWGRNFVYEMANFWQSRVTFNDQYKAYEILGVMSPDEYAEDVDNSIYTNVAASLAIWFSDYLECMAGHEEGLPRDWTEKARTLIEIVDTVNEYHPEHATYTIGTIVKQADVILLGFPLMWDAKPGMRQNDLEIYEDVTDPNGPAMTWGMFAVGHLELGNYERAAELFERSYSPYVKEPFKILSVDPG